jgi:hypothetical protein
MAIRTKFGETIISESLRVDQDCFYDGNIVKVCAKLEGQAGDRHYWISDLIGDKKSEVRDVIRANLKKRESAN